MGGDRGMRRSLPGGFVGTTYCWGVHAKLRCSRMASPRPATLCFLGSLPVSLISVLAIVNSRVIRVLGTRWASIMGVLIMEYSEILSSFAVKSLHRPVCHRRRVARY